MRVCVAAPPTGMIGGMSASVPLAQAIRLF